MRQIDPRYLSTIFEDKSFNSDVDIDEFFNEESIRRSNLRGLLYELIEKLPSREREMMRMHIFENRSLSAIGRFFNVKQSAISYRLRRAKERLRVLYKLSDIDTDLMCKDLELVLNSGGFDPKSALDMPIVMSIFTSSNQSATANELGVSRSFVRRRLKSALDQVQLWHAMCGLWTPIDIAQGFVGGRKAILDAINDGRMGHRKDGDIVYVIRSDMDRLRRTLEESQKIKDTKRQALLDTVVNNLKWMRLVDAKKFGRRAPWMKRSLHSKAVIHNSHHPLLFDLESANKLIVARGIEPLEGTHSFLSDAADRISGVLGTPKKRIAAQIRDLLCMEQIPGFKRQAQWVISQDSLMAWVELGIDDLVSESLPDMPAQDEELHARLGRYIAAMDLIMANYGVLGEKLNRWIPADIGI